jgi:KDO2-lipid IV(A) lauroyltransferase
MSKTKQLRRTIRYRIVYFFVKFLIFISNVIPRRTWLSVCGFLGRLAYVFAVQTRRLTLNHLSLAYGEEKSDKEIKKLARKTFEMLGKNAGDILRSRKVQSLSDLEKFLVTTGYENFEAANRKGKGVIFLTCHMGAFDLQVTNMAIRGLNPNIIGTPLKDKHLNDLLFNYRNQFGAIAIERGKETFRMIKVLKSGGSVALPIDQDTKVKSVFVDFFGMSAATPIGATILAMKTGAAIIPTSIHLRDDGMQHMQIFPEIPMRMTDNEDKDIVFNTQALTSFIEDEIRKHPAQWVWMHERWKTKPGEEIS